MFFWIYTLFVFLHGLVFLMYISFANKWWVRSWLLSSRLDPGLLRRLVVVAFGTCTALFTVTAIGLVLHQARSLNSLAVAAIFSSLSLLVFWDGRFDALDKKGLFGLLINITLLVGLYGFHFPTF
jgi:membrane-associated HD superfamily phosphohydrolase